ncbi:Uncharacterised protein [Mycobacteroides abscessus subsp. abscessus]|nr:Uncharacterised protein [Mycobacteroides abscessus subsp. abscessus]
MPRVSALLIATVPRFSAQSLYASRTISWAGRGAIGMCVSQPATGSAPMLTR